MNQFSKVTCRTQNTEKIWHLNKIPTNTHTHTHTHTHRVTDASDHMTLYPPISYCRRGPDVWVGTVKSSICDCVCLSVCLSAQFAPIHTARRNSFPQSRWVASDGVNWLWAKNDLSYQRQTWYTYSSWQSLGVLWPRGQLFKGQSHEVIERAAGVGMQVDMTAYCSGF